MTQRINITGQRFGLLVAVSYHGGTRWNCVCDCGSTAVVASLDLRQGHTRSCGCYRAEATTKRMTTHGMTGTPTYRSWLSMRRRCYDQDHPQHRYYGGAGIEVCDRWRNDFAAFLSDMGERPEGTTLDRVNRHGNYEPGNCRWATQKAQMNNTRRSIEFEGKTITQWAEELGVHYATVSYRLRKHGTVHEKRRLM